MPLLLDKSPASDQGPPLEKSPKPQGETRPTPRHHSPSSLARIRIKNRRKHYLDTHPSYFTSASRELADPLSYDRLIRRFQSAAEREADGKKKGYSGILEADLWRSEAKIDALSRNGKDGQELSYGRNAEGQIVAEEKDEVPANQEDGEQRWRKQVELRFLRGEDADFDYSAIDEDERFDPPEEARDIQDQWFEEEEEDVTDAAHGEGLGGQTGVQDF